jgi:hypothetical protein
MIRTCSARKVPFYSRPAGSSLAGAANRPCGRSRSLGRMASSFVPAGEDRRRHSGLKLMSGPECLSIFRSPALGPLRSEARPAGPTRVADAF